MRTAHMIVSGTAFAVWTAASVVYFAACDNSVTRHWWLYGPAAALPAFWCVYSWFASRRAEPTTSHPLTLLSVPVLMTGIGILFVAVTDATAKPPEGLSYPIGMGVAMVGECCWPPAALCGLISFIWGIGLHIKRLRQSPNEP